MGTRAPKVFCSYGSPDREVVAGLATWLREQGVDAWLDVWDLVPGESFIAGIEAGLAGAERVLVFLSRRSEEQLWRKAEVEAAIDRMVRDGIPVVPVMIDADAHVPMLLRSRSQIRQLDRPEDRDALLESIHGRSSKPVLGPPPELWSEQARAVLEERFAAARREGSLGVGEAAEVEEALRRVVRERVTWSEQADVCLASFAAGPEALSDLRLPLELLRGAARTVPVVLRCGVEGAPLVPEEPSPRPEGGRIVLATAGAVEAEMLAAVQQACRAGLHHVAERERPGGGSDPVLDRRGVFDPKLDHLPGVTRARLHDALERSGERPGAAVLLLVCRVREGGLVLCDAAGASVVVKAEELAATLEPFAPQLRLVVVLPIAEQGVPQDVGVALVDAALALHRRGVAAVVVPRVPLVADALPGLPAKLLGELLGDARTPPASLEVALGRVNRWLRGNDGLGARMGLRLYARADDGDDTRPLVIRPYRGLAAFEPEHERFYVGRDPEIEGIVERLDQLARARLPRLLLLVGSSGVGKSSLAKAGVVPAMVAAGGWVPVLTRPADASPEQLEQRLGQLDARRRLVVVDQLEQVIGGAGDHEAALGYLQQLWRLAVDGDGTAVVATLRIDALDVGGQLLVDVAGGQTLEDLALGGGPHGIFVRSLQDGAIEQVICEPAAKVGLAVDDGLVERLRSEARHERRSELNASQGRSASACSSSIISRAARRACSGEPPAIA